MPRPRKDGSPAASANRRRLTDTFVETVKPQDRPFATWDSKTDGLVLTVQPSGSRAWKFVYRRGGQPRWYTIGNASTVGLATARRIALKLANAVAEGGDPQSDKKAERGKGTLAEFAARYRDEYAKKENRSWQQSDRLITKYVLPRLGKLRVADIRRDDVQKMFDRLEATPVLANQVLAAVSAIFSWAVKKEVVAGEPVPPDRPQRDRESVARSERQRDRDALAGTAFDLAADPVDRSAPGRGRRHAKRLHPGRLVAPPRSARSADRMGRHEELERPHGLAGAGRARSGRRSPRGGRRSRPNDVMREIVKRVGIERATPHDLRRTCLTIITRLGFGRDAMDRIANHEDGRVRDVYDRHHYSEENRRVMEAVAGHVMAVAEGRRAAGNVVTPEFGRRVG